MPTFDREWLVSTLTLLPPLLLSLTVHEYAHARTALAFGDDTAKLNGRVTLNPLAHLDPIGTLMLIFTRFIGWAKPVPINPANVRPWPLGDILISLAGPMSNLGLAIVSGLALKGWLLLGRSVNETLFIGAANMLLYTALANIGLCVFNLIPLFPLDGHHVLVDLTPAYMRQGMWEWQRHYGMIILMVIVLAPRFLHAFDLVGWLYQHAMVLFDRALGLQLFLGG